MQPQLLPPNVVPHWYAGGPALAAWRGLPPVGDRSPEEWVGATVARFGEPNLGPARLADGTLLRDAVRADPRGWLGRDDGEPGDTGVLVKLLGCRPAPARARASHPGVRLAAPRLRLRQDRGVVRPGSRRRRRGVGRLARRGRPRPARGAGRGTGRRGDAGAHAPGAGATGRRRSGARRHPARDRSRASCWWRRRSPPISQFCWSAPTPRHPTTKFSSASPATWRCRSSRRLRHSPMSLR